MKTKPEAISYIIAKLETAKIASLKSVRHLKWIFFPFQLTLAIAVSLLVFVNTTTTVLAAIQLVKVF